MPILRREFLVSRKIQGATLLIAGLGFYEASINGKKVGDDVLAPVWTNYRRSVRYNSYDATSYVTNGANAIAVMLGNGPFNVEGDRYTKYKASFGSPCLWAQLHLEFADGSSDDVTTDERWRVTAGPIVFSDFYGGEDYDARLELAGWRKPGFDDLRWDAAHTIEGPGGELVSAAGLGARVQRTFRPTHVTQPKAGLFVYDMGQNFSGWPQITVRGRAGDHIRLTPGELLDRSGLVSQRSSGEPMYYTYILRGDKEEQWAPRFTYYGFRYVQVEVVSSISAPTQTKPVIQQLTGEFVYLNLPEAGNFHSSNGTLNQIHQLVKAAIKSNLQGVLTDCPHREKLGWLEQSYLMGPSLLYDFDFRNFLPKILRDVREAQTEAGLIPDIAPEYTQFEHGFRDSPEWGSAGIMLPWMAWQWYGDKGALTLSYASMKAYVDYLQKRAKGGLLLYGLGDWYDLAPGEPGVSKLTPTGVTSTATYYGDLKVMAEATQALGNTTDAIVFRRRASEERGAFQRAFYKEEQHSYASGSQTSLAMPLVLGLAPERDNESILDRLVADIRAKGNHTTAGDIGYRYVLEALTQNHQSSVVFDMATEKTPPSYAGQLAAGATSLTEAWDANPSSSQNHLMLGHIEEWFYSGLAGIRPVFSGDGSFSRVDVDPSPVGHISRVDVRWESSRGPVRVSWRVLGSRFHLKLSVPPGLRANVYLPASNEDAVRTDREAHLLRKEKRRLVYECGSGQYAFEVRSFIRQNRYFLTARHR